MRAQTKQRADYIELRNDDAAKLNPPFAGKNERVVGIAGSYTIQPPRFAWVGEARIGP
ncbi:MAG: hypothetical protein KGJ66_08115 [Alphaproteobacteria bacterium]|nr:hypothetical protein [Alphaproteobacteria bacterium]